MIKHQASRSCRLAIRIQAEAVSVSVSVCPVSRIIVLTLCKLKFCVAKTSSASKFIMFSCHEPEYRSSDLTKVEADRDKLKSLNSYLTQTEKSRSMPDA